MQAVFPPAAGLCNLENPCLESAVQGSTPELRVVHNQFPSCKLANERVLNQTALLLLAVTCAHATVKTGVCCSNRGLLHVMLGCFCALVLHSLHALSTMTQGFYQAMLKIDLQYWRDRGHPGNGICTSVS